MASVPTPPATPKTGDAAFKEQTDAIQRRNDEARARARTERDAKDLKFAARERARELREVADLDTLNAR